MPPPVVRRLPRVLALLALAPLAVGAACGGGGGGTLKCDPPASFPAGVASGPQVALPSPTSMTIAWRTEASALGSVEWGTTPSYGSAVDESGAGTRHALALTGLSPATTYHYRILDDGVPAGGDRAFTTPPDDPGAPVRFVVIGDAGTGCAEEFDAVARAQALAPAFVLHSGDVAYGSGRADQVLSRFLVPFAPLLESVPVFPCLGNHDVKTGNGGPLLDALVLPANPIDGTSRYYSFDWGPCHVALLDSNADTSPGSPQHDWLASDLESSGARWKFVVFHHPPYSSSDHGSDLGVRSNLGPVIDATATDVVFNGHDHDYERTFPMRAGATANPEQDPDYVDPAGTVYVVTGGGGQSLYASGTSDFTAFSVSAFHVVEVEIAGGTLTMTAVALDGTVLDRSTISKAP